MIEHFHFLRPLWLLALIPGLVLWWYIRRRQDDVALWRQFIDPHLLEHLLIGEMKQQPFRPINLLLAMWILSAVALAGPTWQKTPFPFADDEAGLVVLLKASASMMTTDLQPSRLERSKFKLRDLLERRKGSSTGLIVYSGSAHLVMPMTRDHRIINEMSEDLTAEMMPVEGDSLVQALELAEKVLHRAGVPGSVLVISDTVTQQQAQALSETKIDIPVQFLAMQSPSAKIDQGMQIAADALSAAVVKLTVDQSDIERVDRRAKSEFISVAGTYEGERWQDFGYALLPLIALSALMWSRKGWVVR